MTGKGAVAAAVEDRVDMVNVVREAKVLLVLTLSREAQ